MTQVTLLNQIKPLLQNFQDKSRPSFQLLNGTVASVLKALDPTGEGEAIYRIENQTNGNWAEVILTPDDIKTHEYDVVICSGDSEADEDSFTISTIGNTRFKTQCRWSRGQNRVNLLEVSFVRPNTNNSLLFSDMQMAIRDLYNVANIGYAELKTLG